MRSTVWLVWLVACAVVLWMTRNPLYLALALLCIEWVRVALARSAALTQHAAPSALSDSPLLPARLVMFMVPLSAVLNALWTRAGDTILFRLPAWLPLIGGAVTLEALTFGALSGLVLAGFITAFNVINRALPVRALINLVPRAFHPLAVIVSIAITYVPFTIRQAQAVREAQMIRGHELRRVRDWLPLFMPLLAGGLERALQLAEAITARGFANPNRSNLKLEALTLLGIVLAGIGWLLRLLLPQQAVWGWAGLLLGIGLTALSVWRLGAHIPRTRYRLERWTLRDGVVIGAAALAMAGLYVKVFNRASLFYDPYPVLELPQFDPFIGLCILCLAVPAVILMGDKSES